MSSNKSETPNGPVDNAATTPQSTLVLNEAPKDTSVLNVEAIQEETNESMAIQDENKQMVTAEIKKVNDDETTRKMPIKNTKKFRNIDPVSPTEHFDSTSSI